MVPEVSKSLNRSPYQRYDKEALICLTRDGAHGYKIRFPSTLQFRGLRHSSGHPMPSTENGEKRERKNSSNNIFTTVSQKKTTQALRHVDLRHSATLRVGLTACHHLISGGRVTVSGEDDVTPGSWEMVSVALEDVSMDF